MLTVRRLRLALAGAGVVASLAVTAFVPGAASACQWELYEETYDTPAGPLTVPMARCVGP